MTKDKVTEAQLMSAAASITGQTNPKLTVDDWQLVALAARTAKKKDPEDDPEDDNETDDENESHESQGFRHAKQRDPTITWRQYRAGRKMGRFWIRERQKENAG